MSSENQPECAFYKKDQPECAFSLKRTREEKRNMVPVCICACTYVLLRSEKIRKNVPFEKWRIKPYSCISLKVNEQHEFRNPASYLYFSPHSR